MNNKDGKIWFEAGIGTSQLKQGVTSINQSLGIVRNNADKTGNSINDMFRNAALGMGAFLTAQQALQSATQVIDLTAQRELMEKSYEVMFGGAKEAMAKIAEVTEYAILSPYTFEGVAKGVQTMAAFGIETEKIIPSLKMLGDVAAGNAQRFESLSLVFAQTASAGKLTGSDMLQYVGASFNPITEMVRTTGRSYEDLKKQMEAGNITFAMVAEAFRTATSEGGKFHNMTAKMSESIEAYRSTFQSAIIEKQIEWGKNNEDMIKGAYKFGLSLVENIDGVAKAFGVLITTVGTYKASLIALQTVSKVGGIISANAEIAALNELIGVSKVAAATDLEQAVAKGQLSQARATEIAALRAEAVAKLDSLKATQVLTAAEVNSAKLANAAAGQRLASLRLVRIESVAQLAIISKTGTAEQIASAVKAKAVASENLLSAARARRTTVEALGTAQTKAQSAAIAVNTFQTNLGAIADKKATTAKMVFASATGAVTKALKALKLAFASNPIGLLITVLTTAASAWFLFKKDTEEATKSIKKSNAALDKQSAKIKASRAILQDSNVAYGKRVEALEELKSIAPEYNATLTKEGELINNNTTALDNYLISLEKEIALKSIRDELEQAYVKKDTEIRRYQEAEKGLDELQKKAATSDNAQYTKFVKQQITTAKTLHEGAMALIDADIEKAKGRYKVLSAQGEEDKKTTPTTIKEQTEATIKEINKLKKELEGIRSGKIKFEDPTAEIKKVEASLSAAQDKLKLQLGYDPTKVVPKKGDTVSVAVVPDAGSIQDLQNQISDIDATLNLKLLTPEQRTQLLADKAEIQSTIEGIEFVPEVAPTIDVDALIREYETYSQERARVDAEFRTKSLTLQAPEQKGNLDLLVVDWKATLASLDVEAAKTMGTIGKLFEDSANKNSETIMAIVKEAETLLAILSSPAPIFTENIAKDFKITEEQFNALIPKVPELREQIDELRESAVGTSGGFKDFGNAINQMKDGLESGHMEAFAAGLSALGTKIGQASELLNGFGNILGNIGELSGNETWSNIANGISQVTQVLGETMSMASTGVAVGGPIGAVVGGAIGLISSISNIAVEAEKRHKDALKAVVEAEEQYTATVLKLERERELSGEGQTTIFGVDEYAKSMVSMQEYAKEMANLEEQKKKLSEVQIVTGHEKTGLFGWGKGKDVYSGILDVFPDLIDAQGNFDAEIAQTILDTQNLDEESRKTLEGIVATAEQAEAAYKGMSDYLSSIFGGVGNTIADTIADGFRSGKDVGMEVIQDISKGFEQMLIDLAMSTAFSGLFEDAQAELLAIKKKEATGELTPEEAAAASAKILGELAKDSKNAVETAEDILEYGKKAAEDAGLEGVFEPDKTTQGQAQAGGVTTIQETTASSIDGKLTALQITSGQTATNTTLISAYSGATNLRVTEIRDSMDVLNLRVNGIFKHTKLIADYTASLPTIASDMKLVVKNTSKL